MRVDEQQVLSLSQAVWSSLLGLRVEGSAAVQASARNEEPTLSSRVVFSGPWNGALVVECPESIARHAAAMLFSADGETASAEDLGDALNELTKIFAERVCKMLPGPAELSRAELVASTEREPWADGQPVSRLELSCEGRLVRIAVIETETAPTAA